MTEVEPTPGSLPSLWRKEVMKNTNLTEGSIAKGFILFALPLFLGSLFQQLYGTVDLIFCGNYIGKQRLQQWVQVEFL